MNEIARMREALDEAELNLERMRWIMTNPIEAAVALQKVIHDRATLSALRVVQEIDRARSRR